MKGVVFNLLEEVIILEHGEQVWDAVLDGAGVSGAYTSLGNYDDAEFGRLIGAASAKLGIEPAAMMQSFGRRGMPILAERYPHFFEPYGSTRRLLKHLNDIIHPEVRKLYPAADVPFFDFQDWPNGVVLLGYESPRRLCALAHGFIEGAADHFRETVAVEQVRCVERGAARCEFLITLPQGR
jgi:hypothetical protein